jgi:hypothetical protein
VTRKNNTVKAFVDGVFKGSGQRFGTAIINTIGGYPNTAASVNGQISSASIYDRTLSPQEIQELYVDSLAPFRQKSIRIFGGVGIPTDTSKIITVKRSKHVEPSYKSGYAQSAGESAHPNLWDGLVGAWMPSMGVTGKTLRDISGNDNHGTLTNFSSIDVAWERTKGNQSLSFTGVNMAGDFISSQNYALVQESLMLLRDICCEFWIKPKSLSKRGIVADGRANNPKFALTLLTNGKIETYRGSNTQSGFSISSQSWSHVVVQTIGDVTSYYLNGKFSNSASQPYSATGGTRTYIGANYWGGLDGYLSKFSIYNRALSPQEIQTLYVDSLAPFRKKQQVAFNAYPLTLLQKIRSAAKPTTPVSVRVKHNEEPSYKAGYAKSASESANPKLWDGLVSAFVPSFGVTGETLHDLTASNNDGIIYHQNRTINEVWTKTKVGPAVSTYPSGGFQGITTPANNLSMDEFTIVANVRFENRYPGTYPCITVKENNYLDRNWFLGMFPDEEIAFVRSMSGDRWVKSGVVPNKTDFYSIAATSSKVLSHAIYVNGELKNSAHYTGTRSVAGNQNYIGIYKGNINYPLGGSISCILYYSRILSPSEIKHLYADPLAPFRRKAKPIGYQPNKELIGLFRT